MRKTHLLPNLFAVCTLSFTFVGVPSSLVFATAPLQQQANNDADLDPTFGNAGVVMTSVRGQVKTVKALADGRIVVFGTQYPDDGIAPDQHRVLRLNANGSPDQSFAANGVLDLTTTVSNPVFLGDIAIGTDGSVVVGGGAAQPNNPPPPSPLLAAIARYNSKGQLDKSFDNDGIVTFQPTNTAYDSGVRTVNIQPDNRILVSGYTRQPNGDLPTFIARFTSTGLPDSTFGVAGVVNDSQLGYLIKKIIVEPDGHFLAVGEEKFGQNTRIMLRRYTQDGRQFDRFSNDLRIPVCNTDSAANAWQQINGMVLVVGNNYNNNVNPNCGYNSFLSRYMKGGNIDTSFGISGSTIISDFMVPRTSQDDGRILIAGLQVISPTISVFTVGRKNADGSLDIGFGNSGYISTAITSTQINVLSSLAGAADIQLDGRVIVGGSYTQDITTTTTIERIHSFVIVRYRGTTKPIAKTYLPLVYR